MLNKNDVVTVEITDIGVGGEGIGRVDGYTLFIKDAIIGDVVEAKVMKAKKNYGYARMMEIIHPSADRVEPKCAFARKCGGCQIQEMSYERQLAFKEQKIRGNLERIGGFDRGKIDAVMEPVEGMDEPFRYRNKAQFPFGTDKEGNPVTGFYAGRTHDIIANTECILGVEQNREILEIILQYMKENCVAAYDEKSGKGLIRHVLIRYGFTTKEIMVCLVINGTKLPKADRLIKKLTQLEGMTSITLSPNTRRDNVIMGNSYEVLWGQGFITDYIGNVKYQISPLSFYQVNPVQTEKLYGLLDMVEEGKVPWKEVIRNFYPDLDEAVQKAEKELESVKIEDEVTDVVCEECGRNMVIKYGPHGKFLACPGFPECRNTKPYLEKIGVPCPICGKDVVIRKTKKGRRYYGCENNPECEFMSWQKPSKEKCPQCGGYMVEKGNKLVCADEQCGYVTSLKKEQDHA